MRELPNLFSDKAIDEFSVLKVYINKLIERMIDNENDIENRIVLNRLASEIYNIYPNQEGSELYERLKNVNISVKNNY